MDYGLNTEKRLHSQPLSVESDAQNLKTAFEGIVKTVTRKSATKAVDDALKWLWLLATRIK